VRSDGSSDPALACMKKRPSGAMPDGLRLWRIGIR
jgi:hypothetical protein